MMDTVECVDCGDPVLVDEWAEKRGAPVSHSHGECIRNLRTKVAVLEDQVKLETESANRWHREAVALSDKHAEALAAVERLREERDAHLANLEIVRSIVAEMRQDATRPKGGQTVGQRRMPVSLSIIIELERALGPEQGRYTAKSYYELTNRADAAEARVAALAKALQEIMRAPCINPDDHEDCGPFVRARALLAAPPAAAPHRCDSSCGPYGGAMFKEPTVPPAEAEPKPASAPRPVPPRCRCGRESWLQGGRWLCYRCDDFVEICRCAPTTAPPAETLGICRYVVGSLHEGDVATPHPQRQHCIDWRAAPAPEVKT